MWLRIIRRALATTVFCILCDASQAANVMYSWSGSIGLKISLSGGDTIDPWMIGVDGQPFEISVTVPIHEYDVFDQNIRLSGYSVIDATLTLSGESIEYLGNGILRFLDHKYPIADFIGFSGEFQRFGESVELSTSVAIDATALRFTEPSERLPVLESTTTTYTSNGGGIGPYGLLVVIGTHVVVIPEPGVMALLVSGALLGLLQSRVLR